MRTDKYLADVTGLSRKEAEEALRRGRVTVNGQVVLRPEEKLDERTALVLLDGVPLSYLAFYLYFAQQAPGICVLHGRSGRPYRPGAFA